jgi:hypothetical protein
MEARVKSKPDPFAVATTAGAVTAGSMHHVAINIVRDAAKPNAGIWLDGIELASGIVPPADLNASQPLSVANGAQKIHLYHRSLSRPEMLALWLDAAGTGKPVAKHPAPNENGPRFVPQPDETNALIGGTEAVALAESGELEARLLMAFPQSRFHFRSLAWEGDTVFRQDRPMNFGDIEQQLRRVNAGVVFMMFGRQECLDANSASDIWAFRTAFARLLDTVLKVTPNVVVISPVAFEERNDSLLPNMKPKNALLMQYVEAMDQALTAHASESAWRISNQPSVGGARSPVLSMAPGGSADGVQLNGEGSMFASMQIAAALLEGNTGSVAQQFDLNHLGNAMSLAKKLQYKNRLWHDYWRPSNWAFLHGDRTQQPSSRDPVNPQLRFFPAEQEKYLPLIKEAEEKVYKLVEKTTKQLP